MLTQRWRDVCLSRKGGRAYVTENSPYQYRGTIPIFNVPCENRKIVFMRWPRDTTLTLGSVGHKSAYRREPRSTRDEGIPRTWILRTLFNSSSLR